MLFLAASGMLGASRLASAQSIEGAFDESYRTITPQALASGDNIVVIDFFDTADRIATN